MEYNKYIIAETPWGLEIRVLGYYEEHKDGAPLDIRGHLREGCIILGAGFFSFGVENDKITISCFGSSKSCQVESREERDAKILLDFFRLHKQ